MSKSLRESQIVDLWQSLLGKSRDLTTVTGEPFRVIYPGRVNHGRGADFCDAVIATSRGIVTGDIEIHTKSSDWRAHGHHNNPDYNRVVLQVAMEQDGSNPARLADGTDVPLLWLGKYLAPDERPLRGKLRHTGRECPNRRIVGAKTIARLLDDAGEARFQTRAERFVTAAATDPAQSLYSGVMEALGYSRNQITFAELARRLPLQSFEMLGRYSPNSDYVSRVQALLLGTAGLLPSQRGLEGPVDRETTVLEELWTSGHRAEGMPPAAWDRFRVRPNNSPVRRLIAMSRLLLRYREPGLLSGMVNLVRHAAGAGGLETGLVVTGDGYWARHYDFGRSCGGESPSLLGRSRAADIAVNVILPFTLAWSQFHSDSGLRQRCLDLYYSYPRLASNSLEQHMVKQLSASSIVSSARRQQGLLHIYQSRCTRGRCDTCPLG